MGLGPIGEAGRGDRRSQVRFRDEAGGAGSSSDEQEDEASAPDGANGDSGRGEGDGASKEDEVLLERHAHIPVPCLPSRTLSSHLSHQIGRWC